MADGVQTAAHFNRDAKNVNVTVKNIVAKSRQSLDMASRRLFSHYLNKEGHSYLQARKEGLLRENGQKLPLRFARVVRCKVRQNPGFLTR